MLINESSLAGLDYEQVCAGPMTKLFISYAHADTDTVLTISNELRGAGYEVWVDTRRIRGGELWVEEITQALLKCDIFLLFISSISMLSDNVRRELDIAFDTHKKIIPVRLEKVEIPANWKYQLAGIQWIEYQYSDWKPRLLAALGGTQFLELEKQEPQPVNNPNSSFPMLGPIEAKLIPSNRAREFKQALAQLETYRLLVVTGMPGIGKSTFARALLDLRPAGTPRPFWYDFERQRTSGNTLGVMLEQISSYLVKRLGTKVHQDVMAFRDMSDKKASANDVDILIDYLNQEIPIWLVFDNLETVLSRDTKEFVDEGLEILFESLKNNTHNAKIIVTTQIIPNLDDKLFLESGAPALTLEGIDDDSAIRFLRAYGLQDVPAEELKPLVHEINGHPLILNHIPQLIQTLGFSAAMEDLKGGLEEVIERYGDTLEESLSSQEFNALQCLTVLNREIPMAGLMQVAQVKQPLITRLREKGLLQKNDAGKFWLHSIVRSSLQPGNPDLIRQAHSRAMSFYRNQGRPLSFQGVDDYANVLDWHHHAVEAADVVSAYESLYSTGLKDHLVKWNEYDLLVRLCEQTVSAAYQVKALSRVEANLSNIESINIYHTSGIAYFLLGDFRKSIAHLEESLLLLQSQDDPELRIRLMIDLSESYNGIGNFYVAMDICRQLAILLTDNKNDALQAKFLHLRGIVNRDSGNAEAAKSDLEAALKLYGSLNDLTHMGNATIDLGNVYYYQNEFTQAIENYRQALASFELQKDLRGIMLARLNIADIMLQDEQYPLALEEIQPAVDIARKKRFTNLELKASFILIEAQIALSRLDEAEQQLELISNTIKKRNFPCFSGQELLLNAFKHAKRKQSERAMTCFVNAFELLENADCQEECAHGYLLFADFMKEQGDSKKAQETLTKARNLYTRLNNQLGLRATERILISVLGQ